MIFHQPRCYCYKGISLPQLPFGVPGRVTSILYISPDYIYLRVPYMESSVEVHQGHNMARKGDWYSLPMLSILEHIPEYSCWDAKTFVFFEISTHLCLSKASKNNTI